MPHLIWFILLSLLAEILGTVGGFGSSMFFVPVAGYFLDFHAVLGITAIFHLSSNITKIFFFNKGFNKKLVLQLGIPAVVFVILGAYLSKFLDTKILELVLAIFLILLSSILLLFKNLSLKPTTTNSVIGGALSGITAGILGTGGAIRGLTLAAFGLSTEVFIATSAIIDLGIDASRSAVYISNGYVKWHDLYLIPILLVVSIIGTFIGKKILARINEKQFKTIVLLLILATGIMGLYKYLSA
ncbi:MAG: sulfite exporter TauE/SafE family protein [Bacteroidia bacterium]|nr:sulfite exporter TauE/SafE family protein [Bacteroidia bacterium]